MLYRKNLPGWERVARAVAGVTMMLCGFFGPGLSETPAGMILSAAGAMTLLTGFVGFCPACAMVGRKLSSSRSLTHG